MKEKKAKKTGRDIAYYLVLAALVIVFLASGTVFLKNYLRDREHEAQLHQITGMFPEAQTPPAAADAPDPAEGWTAGDGGTAAVDDPEVMTVPPQQWKTWWEGQAQGRFSTYRSLNTENSDMVGWVRIEGTKVDYPVMQTPDDPEYYLHRDFDRKTSNYGIPFMEALCHADEPRTSLLIYGHHMRNGAMFAALQNYTEESYYRKHPYIQFDTPDQAGSYEIAAVVKVDASSDATPWRELLFAGSEEEFAAAWKEFTRQAFYPTQVSLDYGDRLLALVTCEYTLSDGRLMVVAREIR